MKRRLTGLSMPWFGVQWQSVPGDKEIAQRVVTMLEDRRLLFTKGGEVGDHCVQSANIIRDFLTKELNGNDPGPELAATLRAMRAACREFVDKGGPRGRHYGELPKSWDFRSPYNFTRLALELGRLRALLGANVAALAVQYDLVVEGELALALPPVPVERDEEPVDLAMPRPRPGLKRRLLGRWRR